MPGNKDQEPDQAAFLQGGGEMGTLIRQINWSTTAIGKTADWPINLQIATRIILSTPFPMCIAWGPDFIQLYNDGYRPILGKVKHPYALGQSASETFNEIWPVMGKMFNEVMTGHPVSYQHFMFVLERNGYPEECFFDFSCSPIQGTHNEIGGVLVTILETTAVVNNMRLLKESEKRFRTMVELSPVAMLVVKGNQMVVETVNAPMLRLIDKDANVNGMPLFEALPELMGQSVTDMLYRTYQTGTEWSGIEQPVLIKKHGINVMGYYNISFKPLFENEKVTGVLQSAVDVSEQVNARKQLKQSEENFRLLADNISQLAWMTDEMGYIFWYNERWYDYTNTSYEEMKGWGWQNVHHPDHIERVKRKFEAYVKKGEIWEDTFPLRGRDGEYRWFLSRTVPLKDKNGRIQRWFGTNTDITDQRALIQQKEDFISIASHELKTPLTSIKGYIQLLKASIKNDEGGFIVDQLSKADAQVNKMHALIKGVLDLSRFESGKLHFTPQLFNLCVLINEIVEEVSFVMNRHQIIMHSCEGIFVTADREKIGQVITNFLTNASKYAGGSLPVEIFCSVLDGNVEVSVKDKGVGIAADHISKVFDRFYRINNSSTSTIAGFGIGLFICSEIISLHKGKIWLKSELGQGATFSFSLPLQPAI